MRMPSEAMHEVMSYVDAVVYPVARAWTRGWASVRRGWGSARGQGARALAWALARPGVARALGRLHAVVVAGATAALVGKAWWRRGRPGGVREGGEGMPTTGDATCDVRAPVALVRDQPVCRAADVGAGRGFTSPARRGWMEPWVDPMGWEGSVGPLLRVPQRRSSVAAGVTAIIGAMVLVMIRRHRRRAARGRRNTIEVLLREGVRADVEPAPRGGAHVGADKGALPPRQLFGSPVSMRGERFFAGQGTLSGGEVAAKGSLALEEEDVLVPWGLDEELEEEEEDDDEDVVPATSSAGEEEAEEGNGDGGDSPSAPIRQPGRRGRRRRHANESLRALLEREHEIRDAILARAVSREAPGPRAEARRVPDSEGRRPAALPSTFRLRSGRAEALADTSSQNAGGGADLDRPGGGDG